jgi:beta-lactamase superfamily II metal-dependent hydrolase
MARISGESDGAGIGADDYVSRPAGIYFWFYLVSGSTAVGLADTADCQNLDYDGDGCGQIFWGDGVISGELVVGVGMVDCMVGDDPFFFKTVEAFMRKWMIVVWFMFVSAAVLVWLQWPDSAPEVIMCDVGQGDGIIVTQGFSQMVIDTGKKNGAMVSCLGEILPFWDRQIEVVIITHGDTDHAGGLTEVAQAYSIGKVITSEKTADELRPMLFDATEVNIGVMGQRWIWGGVKAEILWPPPLDRLSKKISDSSNDSSLVLRLDFSGGDSAWLAADAGEAVEQLMLNMNLVRPATMLKVSHHGSRYATTEPFLKILQPRYSMISVGKNNYGHPSQQVLDRIGSVGSEIRRTDEMGVVRWKPR